MYLSYAKCLKNKIFSVRLGKLNYYKIVQAKLGKYIFLNNIIFFQRTKNMNDFVISNHFPTSDLKINDICDSR